MVSRRKVSLEKEIKRKLRKFARKEKVLILQRFFKTGPGQYGEGDIFLGVKVPEIRSLVKEYQDLPLKQALKLLKSPIHEERLLALLILVLKYKQGDKLLQKEVYRLYLKHTKYINNWDLVDLTAEHIVGAFLMEKTKRPLFLLAKSKDIWERRISIISTFHFIKNNRFTDTLKISEILLNDREDLIQKGVGWMLREVGKRKRLALEKFLNKHYKNMPRTMLRYAIERFPETKRISFLRR